MTDTHTEWSAWKSTLVLWTEHVEHFLKIGQSTKEGIEINVTNLHSLPCTGTSNENIPIDTILDKKLQTTKDVATMDAEGKTLSLFELPF